MSSTHYPLIPPPGGGTPSLPGTGQPGPMSPSEYTSPSRPNIVSFAFDKIDPPSSLYIQRDDVLVVQVNSQIAGELVTVFGRMLLPYNVIPLQPSDAGKAAAGSQPITGPGIIVPFQFVVATVSALNTTTLPFQLNEGYLLSIGIIPGQTTRTGETFARCFINRGLFVAATPNPVFPLAAGYLTVRSPIGWPGSVYKQPLDSPGRFAAYTPGNPGAGADFTVALNQPGRVRVASITARFVTSAAAANRFPSFLFTDSFATKTVYRVQVPSAIVASTNAWLSLAPGATNINGGGAIATEVDITLPIPSPLATMQQLTIASVTQGIQAADQWSNICVMTEEWLDFT